MRDIKSLIRTIPDYPKDGIMFRDITTLLGDAHGLRQSIEMMTAPYLDKGVEVVVGIEARGFIVGGAVAEKLGTGFMPVRKRGKLPWKTIEQEYTLEYGTDVIEIHEDAVSTGQKVLLVDDLIATGGTAGAAVKILQKAGADIVGAAFIIDLPDLGGRALLEKSGIPCHALMQFEGE